MPFAPSAATPRLLQESKRLADENGVSLTLHFNNSANYVNSCLRDTGMRRHSTWRAWAYWARMS